MDGEGSVTEFSFRTDSGYDKWAIFDVVEGILASLMNYFKISKGGTTLRAVIDHIIVSIDISFLVHFAEGVEDEINDFGVKSKGISGPVNAGAHAPDLVFDELFVVLNKVPDILVESLAVKIKTGFALGF